MKTFFIIVLLMTLIVNGPIATAHRQPSNLESNLLDGYLAQKPQGNWQRIDPHIAPIQRGMDTGTTTPSHGIYMQFDRQGNPKDLLLAQARFVDQGSSPTQRPNALGRVSRSSLLAMIAQYYAEAADDFRSGIFSQSTSPPSVTKGAVVLPVSSAQKLYLWFDFKKRKWMFYSRAGVTGSLIMGKLYNLSIYLKKAAARIITYRSEIFYFKTTGKDIIQVTAIDSDTGQKVGDPRQMRIGKVSKKIQARIRENAVRSTDWDLKKKHKEEKRDKPDEKEKIRIVSPVKESEKENRMSVPLVIMNPKVQRPPVIGFRLIQRTDDHTAAHAGSKSVTSRAIEMYEIDPEPFRIMTHAGGLKPCCLPEQLFNAQFPPDIRNETDRRYFSHPIIRNMIMQVPLTFTQTTTQMVEGNLRPIRYSGMLSYGTISSDYINFENNGGAFRDGRVAAVIGLGVGMGVGAIGMTVGTAGAGTAISALTGLLGGAAVLTGGVAVAAIAAGATFHYLFNLQDAKNNQKRVEYLLESVQNSLSENAP